MIIMYLPSTLDIYKIRMYVIMNVLLDLLCDQHVLSFQVVLLSGEGVPMYNEGPPCLGRPGPPHPPLGSTRNYKVHTGSDFRHPIQIRPGPLHIVL